MIRPNVNPVRLLSFLVIVLIFIASINASCQELPYVWPQDEAALKKLHTWQDWKFGMIIHWGPYSEWGVVESWSLCPEDEPWCIRTGEHSASYYEYVKAYEQIRSDFYPEHFHPANWAKAARAAGMKYVVFTTKHHDGFAMFDTKYSDYKITSSASKFSSHPRSNVVAEVFKAFREQQMGIGAYFSKPDWHHEDYWWPYFPVFDRNVNYDPEKYPQKWQNFQQFTYNQIEELMTEYGNIDLLWLDGGWVRPAGTLTEETQAWIGKNQWVQDIDMPSIAQMAARHQPGILLIDRSVHGEYENYRTPEQQIPDEIPPYPWESCITLGDNWYHTSDKENYKSSAWIVHTLIKIVAKGGNFLLGVGPDKSGELPSEVYQKLAEAGQWIAKNGSAIYGSKPLAPFESGDFYFTQNKSGSHGYIFMLQAEANEILTEIKLPSLPDWDFSSVEFLATDENLLVVTEKSSKKIIMSRKATKAAKELPALVFRFPLK